jgi:glucosyl-3-phosphoglycerate synthase
MSRSQGASSALGARSLLEAKDAAGTTVSVCLPAYNEAVTIGEIVTRIRTDLVEACPLVDEIVVVDDTSTDATARIAAEAGARVVGEADVLPDVPGGSGKGNVLWKSLYECRGDLVCWLDADVRNFDPSFVTRLLQPLFAHQHVVFSKGFYERPLDGAATGGGRVTELVARPLLSLLFPKLADIVQPLAGEYAGRRDALEVVPFVEGWGVEFALLVDLAETFGRDAIAQVDLGRREHRNKPLVELGPQALAILVTALRRADLVELDGATAELVRAYGDRCDFEAVEVRERPPIATLPGYRARFHRDSA